MTAPNTFRRRDALTTVAKALPSSASSAVTSTPIDLGVGVDSYNVMDFECEVSAPALTATMLPDNKTATYDLLAGDALDENGAIDSPVTLIAGIIVQTGADSAGAAAVTKRYRPASNVPRYVAMKCTLGADTTNSSARSMELAVCY